MTNTNTTALVTGANKGIGFETVRQLVAAGWTVWLGSRDGDRGRDAVAKIETETYDGTVRLLVVDVTDDDSVTSAVETVRAEGGLDVLVNNAGVGGGFTAPADVRPADFLPVYAVNLLGPVRMTHAFLPLLRASDQPRIVNVSSGMGSFAVTTDPTRLESTLHGLVYPSSKAALNMVTTMYAKALHGWKINAADPGYTATDLNGHAGHKTVEQGAQAIVTLATVGPDGPTGGFFDDTGPIPW